MSKRLKMPEEKSRKIAIGATVGGVLLIMFLAVFIVIQFVQMGFKQRILNANRLEQDSLQKDIATNEELLGYYESWFGKYMEALKQGYYFPEDQS